MTNSISYANEKLYYILRNEFEYKESYVKTLMEKLPDGLKWALVSHPTRYWWAIYIGYTSAIDVPLSHYGWDFFTELEKKCQF